MNRIFRVFMLLLCLTVPALALAGEDIGGSKDHPLLTRYPGAYITEYSKACNATGYKVGAGDNARTRAVEGDITSIRYFHGSPQTQPGVLQVIRNYQNAIRQIGGEVVYERLPGDGDDSETTLKVHTGGKDVWVKVVPDIYGAPTQDYLLVVTEVAAMAQSVTRQPAARQTRHAWLHHPARQLRYRQGGPEGGRPGHRAADRRDDEGRADPQAQRGRPYGNIGDAASSKALSEARAKSVMNAIIDAGIPAERLGATDFGQERPVADNRSEEGRARNRRVELVKAS